MALVNVHPLREATEREAPANDSPREEPRRILQQAKAFNSKKQYNGCSKRSNDCGKGTRGFISAEEGEGALP